MNRLALKMLFGDAARFFGILVGLTFAALLICQQASIFVGLMTRTYSFLRATGQADVWVMDSAVRYIDEIEPMRETALARVRGVTGVEWAVPLFKGQLRARLADGSFRTVNVVGLDDASMVGAPTRVLEGRLEDLRRADAVIVDAVSAAKRLARIPKDSSGNPVPGAAPIPLRVGDVIEINDRRAVVVGLCDAPRTLQNQPFVYTTFSRAHAFAPPERKQLSFVLARAAARVDPLALARRIQDATGLKARTRDQFEWDTIRYYAANTGIPINFGIAVMLGFLVGTAIAGQTFFNFTLDNLKYFGALKAMGATNGVLLRMVLLQATIAGFIGYGLGVGLAALFGFRIQGTELEFRMIWPIPLLTACAIALISALSATVSLRRVVRLPPAVVFRS